jgi:hypothetical protein
MTRPRAADDFATIRARMHELRHDRSIRPRAADDFATIRARMEELRRERAQVSAGPEGRAPIGSGPCRRAATRGPAQQARQLLLSSIYRRGLFG